jgi:hypothetical protein
MVMMTCTSLSKVWHSETMLNTTGMKTLEQTIRLTMSGTGSSGNIGRSSTEGTDTLPALSGLAKEFQSLTRDKYGAGLWYNNLFEGL